MPHKKVAKHWYWEAEQVKIAADEDLKLIGSPEGWPSEGLDCVGLWFLMFNLMARSARKGYLLDPADDRKPMTSSALAVLTGRTEAVISRIQAVILQRGLFSKNEDGIIYSRGLVKKEELSKKRSKSGRKGGLRTKDLLKQIVQQNIRQTLGIGIGIDASSHSSNDGDFAQAKFREPAERLAFLYRSNLRGRRPESIDLCVQFFSELLALGVSEEWLTTDLKKSPPERDRNEHKWQIKKRALEAAGLSEKEKTNEPDRYAGTREAYERAKAREANSQGTSGVHGDA